MVDVVAAEHVSIVSSVQTSIVGGRLIFVRKPVGSQVLPEARPPYAEGVGLSQWEVELPDPSQANRSLLQRQKRNRCCSHMYDLTSLQ
jgi:hypothetical protein